MRILGLLACVCTLFAASSYHLLRKISVGGDGGWDYVSVDALNRRVFIARFTQVDILDADTGREAGKLAGVRGAHGVALAPGLNLAFVSSGLTNSVEVFDLNTLAKRATIPAGKEPDAIVYEPLSRRVFAMNAGSNSVTVIDAVRLTVIHPAIELNGRPEFAAADGAGQVFVNLQDKNSVVQIDAHKLEIEQRFLVTPCEDPTSMAIDTRTHRLFVGCRNRMLLALDANSGRIAANVPIGAGVDTTVFDPDWNLIYTSTGEGAIYVFHEDTPEHLSLMETIPTKPGSRTMGFEPRSRKLFVPAAEYDIISTSPRVRRRMIPGSFHVLIYSR